MEVLTKAGSRLHCALLFRSIDAKLFECSAMISSLDGSVRKYLYDVTNLFLGITELWH